MQVFFFAVNVGRKFWDSSWCPYLREGFSLRFHFITNRVQINPVGGYKLCTGKRIKIQ